MVLARLMQNRANASVPPQHLPVSARGLLVLCLALLPCLTAPAADAPAAGPVLASFAQGPAKWQRREWSAAGTAQTSPLGTAPAPGPGNAAPPVTLPPTMSLCSGGDVLRAGRNCLPDGTRVCRQNRAVPVHHDRSPWRQVRRLALPPRGALVEITAPSAARGRQTWTPSGHEALAPVTSSSWWSTASASSWTRAPPTAGRYPPGRCLLATPGTRPPRELRSAIACPAPRRAIASEVTFRLGDDYRDPFSRQRQAEAAITTPAGATETVRGFYYEGFLYHPQESDITRTLSPYGAPAFKVRYVPRVPGRHGVRVTATVEGRTLTPPPLEFVALPADADYRGFVRRDPKYPPYLMWDDGTHFWSQGLNVRSPFDTRYMQVVPYSRWRDEGLALYDRLFARYRENGVRVVEVWMSSWWLALEWINDAPGFHGVGYYNPYRAWMLDHILEEAEKSGVYVILVLNNHGKFGALNDTEWARNPYNRSNGGFLDSCEEYFTNDRARAAFRQTCDYIVARWSASPHLLMWKLFSEVDLTGTSYDFYTRPSGHGTGR